MDPPKKAKEATSKFYIGRWILEIVFHVLEETMSNVKHPTLNIQLTLTLALFPLIRKHRIHDQIHEMVIEPFAVP